MIGLTRFSLKRPVTLILSLVTVLYFGLQSLLSAPMEMTPDMNMPMLVVSTVYPGASPEDINELITKPIEGSVATLSGLDTLSANSSENVSLIILQYEYGSNMDTAYLDLRKSLDTVKNSLPEDAQEPTIYQLDINAAAAMSIAVSGGTDGNLYNYVNNNVVPEIEKIGAVGEASVSGGQEDYIKIEMIPEKMQQYGLTMTTLAGIIGAADFSLPAGEIGYGKQDLNVTVAGDYRNIEKIKQIVLPLSTGDVIHLSDVAVVSDSLKKQSSISRYNGTDVVSISVSKTQSSSAVEVSRKVQSALDDIKAKNASFDYKIVYDSADMIIDALKTVGETVLIAVVLAMLVLFVFFGEPKASLIVGSSIPVSVLVTLMLMGAAGFSLNVVSVGSLALGVGMIVDNSIVVIESCFRAADDEKTGDGAAYGAGKTAGDDGHQWSAADLTAIEGTRLVISSIFGSTATTCVVFLPLALLQGLSGQIFKQLGFTIVFCMLASFFSAVMIVPLLYKWVRPKEKTETPVARIMTKVQDGYRDLVSYIIPKKKAVILVSVLLLVLSYAMAIQTGFELFPEIDEGIIDVSIKTQPAMKTEEVDRIASQVEEYIASEEDVREYLLSYGGSGLAMMGGGSGVNMTVYLKKDRKHETAELISKWQKDMQSIPEATVSFSSSSSMGLNMLSSGSVSVSLQSTDYDLLKQTVEDIAGRLKDEPFITQVHHSAENSASVVKVIVDPVKAQSYGLTPLSAASTVYMNLSGSEVMNYTSGGNEVSVRLENPEDQYSTIEDVADMPIPTMAGVSVRLGDIAEITWADSAKTISRTNKQYQVSISGQIPEGYEDQAQSMTDDFIDRCVLPEGVERQINAYQEIINEELGSLLSAILTAIFLVFIVMAMQFESPRLSLMVMFTIPFASIGAFGLLFACNVKIAMTPMLGFLMLVGTVVNNGILYVDTVGLYRDEMGLDKALVEAGATRIRPMLMTTLTTILAMLPMAFAKDSSAELLQGLALVNIGGLLASTVLTLLLLPTVYSIFGKKQKAAA